MIVKLKVRMAIPEFQIARLYEYLNETVLKWQIRKSRLGLFFTAFLTPL